jgi:GABA(A) receptor-associated protein
MDFLKKIIEDESPEERLIRISKNIREANPHKIPIIVKGKNLKIQKERYVVSKDTSLGNFTKVIRKYIQINDTESIYVLVNNTLHTPNKTFREIDTGEPYLTLVLCKEETYG